MAAYASDTDLETFIPSILENGVVSFDVQLQLASDDVLEMVKVKWWVNAVSSRYALNRETTDWSSYFPRFDEALLNTVQLKNLTCYRAFHKYICPMLTGDADDADEWTRKEERYKIYFDEEWDKITRMPLYDFNQDSAFDDIERRQGGGVRLQRA